MIDAASAEHNGKFATPSTAPAPEQRDSSAVQLPFASLKPSGRHLSGGEALKE